MCELSIWIPRFRFNGKPIEAQETNHIFGGTSGRHDLISNLIRLDWEHHRWFHEKPADGRVCCLWVKHQKGEINVEELKKASGSYLAGWLMRVEIREEFTQKYLDELREIYN